MTNPPSEFYVATDVARALDQLLHHLEFPRDAAESGSDQGSLHGLAERLRQDAHFDDLRSFVASSLAERGFSVLRGLAADRDHKILVGVSLTVGTPIHYFGQPLVRPVRPVKGRAKAEISSGVDEALLHTDKSFVSSPPNYIGMQCETPDLLRHGRSLLSDGRQAYAALPEAARHVLRSVPISIEVPKHIVEDDCQEGVYVVSGEPGAEAFRLRYDLMIPRISDSTLAEAMDLFYQELVRVRFEVGLQAGDVLFVDNRWVLHSRTALSGYDSPRVLWRVYLD